jgi:hypothetical protein
MNLTFPACCLQEIEMSSSWELDHGIILHAREALQWILRLPLSTFITSSTSITLSMASKVVGGGRM